MESLIEKVKIEIDKETENRAGLIGAQYRKAISSTYKCMSACYRKGKSLERSRKCAEKCKTIKTDYEEYVDNRMRMATRYLERCVYDCDLRFINSKENHEACVLSCPSKAIRKSYK